MSQDFLDGYLTVQILMNDDNDINLEDLKSKIIYEGPLTLNFEVLEDHGIGIGGYADTPIENVKTKDELLDWLEKDTEIYMEETMRYVIFFYHNDDTHVLQYDNEDFLKGMLSVTGDLSRPFDTSSLH